MDPVRKHSISAILLTRWYWAVAILLTTLIWVGLSLAIYPVKDPDGSFASRPYGVMTGLENRAVDLLFQLRDARRSDQRTRGLNEPITIIEIDEASIKTSNVRLQKWPRDWYARLIDRASMSGASVIGVDTFLSEAGGTSAEDKAADQVLAKSIADAGNVVIAMKTAAGGFDEIKPLPMFADTAYAVGFVDLPLDSDGFVRSIQLFQSGGGNETQFSFATRVAEGYLAANTKAGTQPKYLKPATKQTLELGGRAIQLRNDLNLQLDFRGRSPAFKLISAADILFNPQAQIPSDLFRDRIVLIGAANIDAPDLFPTPFYEPIALPRLLDRSLPVTPKRTPGVEVQAAGVATLLFGNSPIRPRYVWQVFLVLGGLMLVAVTVFCLRVLWGMLSVLLIAAFTLILASWMFNDHGVILPLITSWLGMAILTPAGLGLRFARERLIRTETEAERAQVMDIFSRFVSRDVANTIWERRGQESLVGENRTVTIVFTDIRDFTTLSESEPSEKVVKWLNDYFGRMNAIVERHGGHINKYIGDGLMIVFGAPMDRGDKNEARAAVDCSLAMLREVERMNENWKGTGRPIIKIGCGIHSGLATCGVVGAERRLEYTVIGDTVNLAARLESTTKELNVPILISEQTTSLIGDTFATKSLGEVKVKGKTLNTAVYTVEDRKRATEAEAPASLT